MGCKSSAFRMASQGVSRLQHELENQWALCQWGLDRCEQSPSDRERVVEWLYGSDNPLDAAWAAIVEGDDPASYDFIVNTPDFPHGNGHWRQMVSSSPFPLLIRSKTRETE